MYISERGEKLILIFNFYSSDCQKSLTRVTYCVCVYQYLGIEQVRKPKANQSTYHVQPKYQAVRKCAGEGANRLGEVVG